jgi:[ribosomal protein S18]-alanine N-acetyltransferase
MNRSRAPIEVRPMTSDDLDRVIGIAGRLKQAPSWPRTAYQAALAVALPRRLAFVAEHQGCGEIVGFLIALMTPPEAEIETLAVVPGLQRQGIGRLLLDRLQTEVRAHGVTAIHLEVRVSNRPALGLYRQTGFAEVARRVGYYADPVEDAVAMRRGLGPSVDLDERGEGLGQPGRREEN